MKTVYIEDLPDSWDEKKIREICQHYGEIEKVQMFRKSGTKKKDFAFVKFTSRESALACVEGMNSGQLGECDVNVCASVWCMMFVCHVLLNSLCMLEFRSK